MNEQNINEVEVSETAITEKVKLTGRQIVLKIADEIEKSEHYSGSEWWNNYKDENLPVIPDEEKGCAITRILMASGATILFQGEYYLFLGINNREVHPHQFVHYVAELTNISANKWDEFRKFSETANNKETAIILRQMIHEAELKLSEEQTKIKNAILKVADDIEKSEHYDGTDWWDSSKPDGEKGCASTRIFLELGAEIAEEGSSWIKVKYKDHIIFSDIEELEETVGKIFGDFIGFSIDANNVDTANRLREIAAKIGKVEIEHDNDEDDDDGEDPFLRKYREE